MGLDVSHDCWSGGYGSFHIFREQLAKAAGIPLDMMAGYYAPDDRYHVYQPPHAFEEEEYKKRPDWSAKVKSESDILRRYFHPSWSNPKEGRWYVEVPDPYQDPINLDGISPDSLEWLRPRGPDGPLCESHHGPSIYRWIVAMAQWLPLSWDTFKDDPIVTLLNHSDCSGDIRGVKVQRALAARLEEMAPLMPSADEAGGGHLHDMGGPGPAALQFAKGLREAASKREVVRFT